MENAVLVLKNCFGNNPELQTSKFYFSTGQIEGEMDIESTRWTYGAGSFPLLSIKEIHTSLLSSHYFIFIFPSKQEKFN